MATASKKLKKVLTVVIPAYNEGETIKETITNLKKIKSKLAKSGFDYRIIVVNDGSKDQTGEEARKAGADKVIQHKVNIGLGAAVRSGLNAALKINSDITIKFDADLQHDPLDILEIIKPIINDEADIVYGKRFQKIKYKMPIVRRLGNKIFTKIMRFLTKWPLEDSQPGIFAINYDYLSVFNLPGDYNYTQQILLDAYHKGMRFDHVPVTFNKREKGKSFVSFKYPVKVFYQILMVLMLAKPMKVIGSTGICSLLVSLGIFIYELIQWSLGNNVKPVVHVNAVLGFLMLGLQLFFFGLLADLIVRSQRRK